MLFDYDNSTFHSCLTAETKFSEKTLINIKLEAQIRKAVKNAIKMWKKVIKKTELRIS